MATLSFDRLHAIAESLRDIKKKRGVEMGDRVDWILRELDALLSELESFSISTTYEAGTVPDCPDCKQLLAQNKLFRRVMDAQLDEEISPKLIGTLLSLMRALPAPQWHGNKK